MGKFLVNYFTDFFVCIYEGSEKADVVNCKTGGTIEKMEIGTFWKGFESVKGLLFLVYI